MTKQNKKERKQLGFTTWAKYQIQQKDVCQQSESGKKKVIDSWFSSPPQNIPLTDCYSKLRGFIKYQTQQQRDGFLMWVLLNIYFLKVYVVIYVFFLIQHVRKKAEKHWKGEVIALHLAPGCGLPSSNWSSNKFRWAVWFCIPNPMSGFSECPSILPQSIVYHPTSACGFENIPIILEY